MELKKISYFLQIVDSGSLSKAANALYLTQPTLSRFLAKLEEELGTKLFVREKDNSLTLTRSGEIYLQTAREIEALRKALEDKLAHNKANAKSRILLAVDAENLISFADKCAAAVTGRFPEVSVQILRKNSCDIFKRMKNGSLDVGLTAYGEQDPSLNYIPIRTTPIDLIVGPEHPLVKECCWRTDGERPEISILELDPEMPVSVLCDGTILRQLEDEILAQLTATPRIVRTYMRQCTGNEMVAASKDMISFCPRGSAGGSVISFALEPVYYYSKGICYTKQGADTPACRYLIELLKRIPDDMDIYS